MSKEDLCKITYTIERIGEETKVFHLVFRPPYFLSNELICDVWFKPALEELGKHVEREYYKKRY